MKFFSSGAAALTGTLALLSVPLADAAAPAQDGSLVLSFKAARGKGPELLQFMSDSADYILENQSGVLSAYGFKISGKEEYVFVERYATLDDLLAWAKSDAHTEMIGRFIPLIDVFSAGISSSVPLLDIIGGLLS